MGDIMDFRELLYTRIKEEISRCSAEGVYAVYFGVRTDGIDGNKPHFDIGFGVEGKRGNVPKWCLAELCENKTEITADPDIASALEEWLHSQGVENIGSENLEDEYDEFMMYVGKGPEGKYQLIGLCTDIAKQLFAEGVIREKFGRDIPVIFDDTELCWYHLEATENANPEGLADEFLRINAAAGKNSEAARSLADMLLAGMGIYIIMALFPTSLAASVMTLIFGGVMYPLTVGGFIKAALITAFMGYTAFKKAMLAGSASSADNGTAFRALAVMIADVLAAAVIIFSCNFAPDRFFALLFVLLAVLYCGLSYFNMSEKMRSMSNEEKKKMSDGIKKIRGRKNNKDDKDNK